MFHMHKWAKVEMNQQTCTVCGKTRTVECNHIWGEVENRTQACVKCGEVRGFDCPHKWQKTETIKTSNRFSGHVYRMEDVLICSLCGEIKVVELRDPSRRY